MAGKIKQDIPIGSEFHFLTTQSEKFVDNGKTKIKCICVCGKETEANPYFLKIGKKKSCGCWKGISASQRISKINTKYSKETTKHSLYFSYKKMKSAQYNSVDICDEWKNNYSCFYDWAIVFWKKGLVLSRKDKNLGFFPENCWFITRKESIQNGCMNNITYKNKAKQTCLKKYGVSNYSQTKEHSIRFKQTCLDKYGYDSPTKVPEIRDKQVKTLLERYGRVFVNPGKKSKVEKKIKVFVEDVTKKQFESTYQVLKTKEIDIYNEELKFGIEFCGISWHSEFRKRMRNYHYSKYQSCKEAGIRLITIFSDEYRK